MDGFRSNQALEAPGVGSWRFEFTAVAIATPKVQFAEGAGVVSLSAQAAVISTIDDKEIKGYLDSANTFNWISGNNDQVKQVLEPNQSLCAKFNIGDLTRDNNANALNQATADKGFILANLQFAYEPAKKEAFAVVYKKLYREDGKEKYSLEAELHNCYDKQKLLNEVINNDTLTIYKVIDDLESETADFLFSPIKDQSYANLEKVVVKEPGIKPSMMKGWFYDCKKLNTVVLDNLNTESVTDMSLMFYQCSSLTSLNLSSFKTANVANMGKMFSNCSNLVSLELSSFDMGNVTNMYSMFQGCSSLKSLDVSKINNTQKVKGMGSVFLGCSSLTSLNLSNFDTSNVTDMEGMFQSCSSLTSLELSNFDTSNVTSMHMMFDGCSSLTSLDLSNFDTSNVTSMSYMFCGCKKLGSLDVSKFNTEKVMSMYSMFRASSGLTSLDLSSFNTKSVTDMSYMFTDCTGLMLLNLSNFNTKNVEDYSSLFKNCEKLESVTLNAYYWSGSCIGQFGNFNLYDENGLYLTPGSVQYVDRVATYKKRSSTAYNQLKADAGSCDSELEKITQFDSLFDSAPSSVNVSTAPLVTSDAPDEIEGETSHGSNIGTSEGFYAEAVDKQASELDDTLCLEDSVARFHGKRKQEPYESVDTTALTTLCD